MKTRVALLAVAVLMFAAAGVMAQEGPGMLARAYYLNVSPGNMLAFEEAYAKHIDWHKQKNDDWTWETWQVTTGDSIGTYVLRTPGHHWADFDANPELRKEDSRDYLNNVAKYVDSLSSNIEMVLPDVSRLPEGDGTAKMVAVYRMKVRYGYSEEFRHAIKKAHEAIVESEWPRYYVWLSLVSGGEQPVFTLVRLHDNWASMAPPETGFWGMMEEVYGAAEAHSLRDIFRRVVESQVTLTARYREDLSCKPAGN